jgi:hypothetical protein
VDTVNVGDVRRHNTDLWVVMAACVAGKHAGYAHVVPLTTVRGQGVYRINDRYAVKDFRADYRSLDYVAQYTTWTGDMDRLDRLGILEAFRRHTAASTMR